MPPAGAGNPRCAAEFKSTAIPERGSAGSFLASSHDVVSKLGLPAKATRLPTYFSNREALNERVDGAAPELACVAEVEPVRVFRSSVFFTILLWARFWWCSSCETCSPCVSRVALRRNAGLGHACPASRASPSFAVPVVAAVSTVVSEAVSFTDVASNREGGGDLPVGLTHSGGWWLRGARYRGRPP